MTGWLVAGAVAVASVVLGAGVGVFLGGLLRVAVPTRGPPIPPTADGTAVLVLSLQPCFLEGHAARGLVSGIAALVGDARGAGVPVLAVRTVFSTPSTRLVARVILRGRGVSGSTGLALEPGIQADAVLDKSVGDARGAGVPVLAVRTVFSTPSTRLVARVILRGRGVSGSGGLALEPGIQADAVLDKSVGDALDVADRWLRERGVRRLVLVGVDAVGCVHRTARGALRRGYQVVVVDALVLPTDAEWQERLPELREAGVTIAAPDGWGAASAISRP